MHLNLYESGACFSLITGLMLLGAMDTTAANHYVRQGASGSGSDWTNACGGLPSTLTRGDTYYVADGSYSGYTFDDAESGTFLITVRKATVTDHGTETGWQNGYGDGQALFGDLTYMTGWYEVDGRTRNESNWQDVESYGFRVVTSLAIEEKSGHITHKYVDLGGTIGSVWPDVPFYGVKMQTYPDPWRTHLVFHRMHIHNVNIQFHSRCNNNVTIEYCHIGPGHSKEVISHQYGHNWVIRYNKFVDGCVFPASEGCTADIGFWQYCGTCDPSDVKTDNAEIYGNVFAGTGLYSGAHATGVIFGDHVKNWKVYNNTLYNMDGSWGGGIIVNGTGNAVYNNLLYKVRNYDDDEASLISFQASLVDHSWCFEDNPLYAGTARVDADCRHLDGIKYLGTENPFVNASALDFRLKDAFAGPSPINNGKTLGTGFNNVDAFGNVRGADGAWDIGAFEHSAGISAEPVTPTMGPLINGPALFTVYDITGRLVSSYQGDYKGRRSFAKKECGLQNGIYLFRVSAGGRSFVLKRVVIK